MEPVVVLIALGAALRFCFLGVRSLWFDEASTLMLARTPLAHLPKALIGAEMNPPMFYWLLKPWLLFFPDPRIGIRAFSAAAGVAALVMFALLTDRILPKKEDRVFALALAALSPFWIHFAQDGRVYSWLLFLALALTVVAWDLRERPTRLLWSSYAVVAALGLWSHYYFAVLLLPLSAWLMTARSGQRREFFASHAAIALLYAPWVPWALTQIKIHAHDGIFTETLGLRHLFDTYGTMFFDPGFLGLLMPAWLLPALGVAAAALIVAAAGQSISARLTFAQKRRALFAPCVLAAFTGIVAAAEIVLGRPITQARYFAAASPFLYICAAQALSGAGNFKRAARILVACVVAAGAVAWHAAGFLVDPHLDKLADALRKDSDRRRPIVHLGTYYYLPMRFYYLPERANFLNERVARGMNYSEMPPYDGVVGKTRVARWPEVVLIDEDRRIIPRTAAIVPGPRLAENL